MLRFLVPTRSTGTPAARLLAQRLGEFHPEAELIWLVCDPRCLSVPASSTGPRSVFAASESVSGRRYVDLLMATSEAFARWAVIARVADQLLADAPGQTIVVLPPTVQLSGALDELVSQSGSGALFLPRFHDPASGAVTGGWIPETLVLGPKSRALLHWWQQRVDELLVAPDLDDAVRRDPWASFLDTTPDIAVGGEGRYRVSPWNTSDIRLDIARDGSHLLADGRPLVLAHFPGFDPTEPWWYAPPGETTAMAYTSRSEPLRLLCRTRAEELADVGGADAVDAELQPLPGWSLGPVTAGAFRRALVDGRTPPNPFVSGEVAGFAAWATSATTDSETGLSVVADEVWRRRPDLAAAIPAVKWAGRPRFVRWMWSHGLAEHDTTLAMLPDPPRPARHAASVEPKRYGVNLVGYHDAEKGLGVAVRRVAGALDAAGIPWKPVAYDRTTSRRREGEARDGAAPYWFHLVLTAPDQLPVVVEDLGADFFEGHHTIGLWYWETDVLTPSQLDAIGLVDEIWGATRYLADVFGRHTDKPVLRMPVALEFPGAPGRAEARSKLGLDDRFTVLFSFDFLSIPERKNPGGAIEAYRRAFPDRTGTRLIIKTINGEVFAREREELAHSFADEPDIELWDRYLSSEDRLALVAAADCYLSLHRSEGLGLTMAEAMSVGTPVVATRYSGNLDFMDDRSAMLVDADEIRVGPGHYYPANGHWADPDLDQAASHLRRLRDEPELGQRIADEAARRLRDFTSVAVGRQMSARLVELWRAANLSVPPDVSTSA